MEALKEGLQRAGHEANLALQQRAETECLRQFAGERGWGLDPRRFAIDVLSEGSHLGGGNEHDVYFHTESQRVIKITKYPPNYGAQGSPFAYLTNLEFQNSLFGDDILFEGLLQTPTGHAVVTTQPFIEGIPASQKEIDRFFDSLGFESLSDFTYRYKSRHEIISVFDCRPDNIFRSNYGGEIFPIDIQIKVHKSQALASDKPGKSIVT